MSDETQTPEPPVIDPDVEAAGNFVLRTRMLVRMGISFQDPRLQQAVTQLGIWPQLVFDLQADEGKPLAEVRVQEVEKVVEYNLTLATVPEGDELAKRAGALIGWTQQLLGEEWAVVIENRKKKGGKYKVLQRGERQRPVEPGAPRLEGAPFPEAVSQFRRYRSDPKKPTFTVPEEDLGPIIRPKQQ